MRTNALKPMNNDDSKNKPGESIRETERRAITALIAC